MRQLGPFLESLYGDYHRVDYLRSDPVEFIHRYQHPEDQEVVALVAALLAYGNVRQIRQSVQKFLDGVSQLAPSPSQFARRLREPSFRKEAEAVFWTFVHRFNVGSDLIELCLLAGMSSERYGSVGAHWVKGLRPDAVTVEGALSAMIQEWRVWRSETQPGRLRTDRDGFDYLLTDPAQGSACKRWVMLLRWMVRKDSIDLGLWQQGSEWLAQTGARPGARPSQLILPLDTHTGRISQYLGLTNRKSLNWDAALEVTEGLREIDPFDPVRFDFALSRLGILDLCQRKYRAEICHQCPLLPGCRFARASSAASRAARKIPRSSERYSGPGLRPGR